MRSKMISKRCSKCKQVKSLDEFSKNKNTKDGHHSRCKKCVNEYSKEYREKHRKPIKLRTCKRCGEKFKPTNNNQKYCSKKCYKIVRKKINEIRCKKWYKQNKEYIKGYWKEYQKIKRKTDLNFRIASNYRNRINRALKRNWKKGHTLELLDCSVDKLRKYIESLWKPGMSWNNYGRKKSIKCWELDHKDPCASFDLTKESEQKRCFHWTNLQPLWAKENLKKGAKV